MKKLIILFLILNSAFCIHNSCTAQNYQWAHGFGGPNYDSQGNSIATDAQGNVYVTGTFGDSIDFDPGNGNDTLPANGETMFIAKYDSSGTYKWAIATEGLGTSNGKHISVSIHGVFIIGQFNGTVDFDPGIGVVSLTALSSNTSFIARYDNFGSLIWVFKIDGSVNDFDLDIDGNIYLTGVFGNTVDFDPSPQTYNLTSIGGSDVFTAKYDSSNNLTWAKSFGGNFGDAGFSLLLINNEIIIHGLISDTADMDPGTNVAILVSPVPLPDASYFFAKYDTSGNYLMAYIAPRAGFGDLSKSNSVYSSFYVVGSFSGTVDFDIGVGIYNIIAAGGGSNSDVFFAKYDSSFNLIWVKSIQSLSFYDAGWDIVESNSGSLFLTGYFGNTADFDPGNGVANLTSAGDADIFLAQYDTAGNYKWAGSMGGTQQDAALSLALDVNGNQYLTGFFENIADFDPYVATVNLTGLPFIHSIFIAKYDDVLNGVFFAQKPDELKLTIYPNPANNGVAITAKEKIKELAIFNVLGEEIFNATSVASHINLSTSPLPNGIYFVQLTSENKSVTQKLIVQH